MSEGRGAQLCAFADTDDSANVVLFARPQQNVARETPPPVLLKSSDRPAPGVANPNDQPAWLFALLLCSLALHGGLFMLFHHEPEPHASVGMPAISVEIVLGADTPAGVAQTPSPNETQETEPTEEQQEPAVPEPVVTEREEDDAERPVETEAETEPETKTETEPETKDEAEPETKETEPEMKDEAEAPPVSDTEAEIEAEAAPPQPEPEPEETAEPISAPPPVQPKQARKPKQESKQAPAPKPEQDAKDVRRPKSKAKQPPPSRVAPAASGVGRGRSSADANYHGLVAAHLRRHKQYPPEASARGEQGAARVTFSIDGSGRVRSVRLVRSSGAASLDRESVAMVRRASPFPAPPSGRGMSFTVPVTFNAR